MVMGTDPAKTTPGMGDLAASPGSTQKLGGRRALLLVILIALLPRALRFGERVADPDLASPAVDAHWHDAYARELAGLESSWPVGFPVESVLEEPLHRPPGYPWFLAAVDFLGGGDPRLVLWIQFALGLLTVALVFRLAAQLGGPRAGVVAGLLYGLAWTPVHFEAELHAPALLGALVMGALSLLLQAGRPLDLRRASLAGVLLAAAVLTRPNTLLPALLLLGWLLLRSRQDPRSRVPLLVALGLLLCAPIPSLVRNWSASGRPVPMTTALGVNLYLGQRPEATGVIDGDLGPELGFYRTCFDWPNVVTRLSQQVGRPLTHEEADAELRRRALAAMGADPAAVITRTLTKASLLLGAREIGHNKEVEQERRRSALRWAAPVGFAWLGPLAIAAVVLFLGGRRRADARPDEALPPAVPALLVWLGGWAISLLPFFVSARYRVPMLPMLSVLAGWGALRLWSYRREVRTWLVLAGLLLLPHVLTAVSSVDTGTPGVKEALDRGRAHFRIEHYGEAAAAFEEAMELAPRAPEVLYERALAHLALGEERAGGQRLEEVLAAEPRHPKASANLARLLAEGRGMTPDRPRAARLLAVALLGEGASPQYVQLAQSLVLELAAAPGAARRDGASALELAEALLAAMGASDGMPLALTAMALAEQGRFEEAMQRADLARQAAQRAGNSTAAEAAATQAAQYARREPFRLGAR